MISAYIEYQGISKQFETSSSELKQEFCAMPMVRRFGVAVIFRIAPRKSPSGKLRQNVNCQFQCWFPPLILKVPRSAVSGEL
jgi:hypothetical protein